MRQVADHADRHQHVDDDHHHHGDVDGARQLALRVGHVGGGVGDQPEALVADEQDPGGEQDVRTGGPPGRRQPVGVDREHAGHDEPDEDQHLDCDDQRLRLADDRRAEEVDADEEEDDPGGQQPRHERAGVVGQERHGVAGEPGRVEGDRDDVGEVLEDVQPAGQDAVAEPLDEELHRAARTRVAHAELRVRVGGEQRHAAADQERHRQRRSRHRGDHAEDREDAGADHPADADADGGEQPDLAAAAGRLGGRGGGGHDGGSVDVPRRRPDRTAATTAAWSRSACSA